MEKAKLIVEDIFKSIIIGGLINVIIAIIIFIISLSINNEQVIESIFILRSVLLFLSGFLLLIFAVIFYKGFDKNSLNEENRKRKYFKIISNKYIFFIIILMFIISSSFIDSIARKIL